MLYKEFISALVMTGIVTAFAIPMTQLSGESQVVPAPAADSMGIFNVGQYILAGLRYAAKIDVKMTMRGYPLRRVGRALRPHRPVSCSSWNPWAFTSAHSSISSPPRSSPSP